MKKIAYVSIPNKAAHFTNFNKNTYIYLNFPNWYLLYYYTIIIYKNKILDFEKFILSIYIVDNYCNIYSKNFVLDLIWIEDLKSVVFILQY